MITAAFEARVREDFTTLPEESRSWGRHAEKRPLHHCGHRDGHRRPRRGQDRWIRTPARAALSDLPDARACYQGQLPEPSDSDARPGAHWLTAEASAVIAAHREAAALETARKQHTGPCSGCPSPALDQTSLGRDKPTKAGSKDRGAKAQRPKEAGQIQTGS